MAIYSYYGKPGQGKSYSVVSNVIVPALRKDRVVYTNIPLTDKCLALGGKVVPFDNDVEPEYFSTVEKGAVLVVDEAWRYCPAGQRSTVINEDFKQFLAMHRHYVNDKGESTQIYFVTQSPSQINTFVKSLIDTAYVISKKSGLGITQFRTDVYSGDAATKASGTADNKFFSKFNPENFEYYKTSTLSDTGAAGDESVIDTRGGIAGNALIKYGLPLSLGLVIFGIYKGVQTFQEIGGSSDLEPLALPAPARSVPVAAAPVRSAPVAAPVAQPAGPVYSSDFRVVGYADYTDDYQIVHVEHVSGFLINLDVSRCEPLFDSYQCYLNGELVTGFTGKPSSAQPVDSIISAIPFSDS